jgi:SprB repeat/Reeler domain
MMKFVYQLFFVITISLLWFSLSSYKGGAATKGSRYTGGPFDSGNCAKCHLGGSYGTVSFSVQIFEVGTTTPITSYVGGKAYDAKLTINSTTASPGYGFQMVAVSGTANIQAGTWSNFPVSVGATTLLARSYVEHKAVLSTNSHKMTWTAPAAGSGVVKFYVSGNCVDKGGDEALDNAGASVISLPEAAVVNCVSATLTPSVSNASCANSATGSINLAASGGTAPFTYL